MTEQPSLGKLIVFEGLDDVGKSTLAKRLTSRLCETGVPCKCLSFPGKQPGSLGRLVYDLHHNPSRFGLSEVNQTSMQTLHIAAHIDAVEGQILPALNAGTWVVLDRFWWSTWVYGVTLGVPENSLKMMISLEQLHWGQVKPDALFLVERESGSPDGGGGQREQILEGYRELASREQTHSRVTKIRNDSSVEDALASVWKIIMPIAR